MKVFWTKSALASLFDIHKYYKENVNSEIAGKIRDIILSSTSQLDKHSHSGQIEELLNGVEGGYRHVIRGNYKII